MPLASVWEHFGGLYGPLESLFEGFGALWVDLGNHCVHIGGHWEILGSWVVTFGAFRLDFGKLLGVILRSFGVILGALGS